MIQSQMLGGGLSGGAAQGIAGGVSNTLTAAGTTQADALALALNSVHFFSTVGSGAGARIPANMNPGDGMEIFNGGASTLAIYPPLGGTINNVAANGNFDVATLKSVLIRCVTPLKFFAMLGA